MVQLYGEHGSKLRDKEGIMEQAKGIRLLEHSHTSAKSSAPMGNEN